MRLSFEWRVAVELSHDLIGLQELLNKDDIHSNNQEAFSLPSRLISKKYLFRTIFRGSGWSFAHDNDFLHVSSNPDYWDKVNEKFYKKYHGLDERHKEWAEDVVQGRSIKGPLGGFWPIEMGKDKKGNLYIPWTILTNYPVQGTAAHVMSIARISFFKRLKKTSLVGQVKLVSSVHDSIVVDAPSSYLPQIGKLFHEVFADLQKNINITFAYNWKTPLLCEVKYGNNMKQMTKYLA